MNVHSLSRPLEPTRDEYWMQKALELAANAWGNTEPNPMVGAVLVDGNEMLASGYHRQAGKAHAEVEALRSYEKKVPVNCTLYVTLEPCSSHGRTPPCTQRILEAGVRRVVIGCKDPDARHQGQGIRILRSKGVEVICGVMEAECRDLNLAYHFRLEKGYPIIAAKFATTLDGKVATATGDSQWITGKAARQDVHHWRRYFSAIGVGAGTVLADDPSLTARETHPEYCPLRVVFDRSGCLLDHLNQRIFTDSYSPRTVLFTSEKYLEKFGKALTSSIRMEILPSTGKELRSWLTREGCNGLYVEGGASLLSSFIHNKLIDYIFAYRAPKILFDEQAPSPARGRVVPQLKDALELENCLHKQFGDDQMIRGFLKYPSQ